MDNDDNPIKQNIDPTSAQIQPQAPTQVPPVKVPVPSQSGAVSPVGSSNKEMGPVTSPVSEFIRPSETEPQIDKDIAELGVEVKKEAFQLTDDHRQAGIKHSGVHVPVQTMPTGSVKLPMSEEEITNKLKVGQDDDSGKWLAGLLNKIMSVMSANIRS